jgi:hypothetical protein
MSLNMIIALNYASISLSFHAIKVMEIFPGDDSPTRLLCIFHSHVTRHLAHCDFATYMVQYTGSSPRRESNTRKDAGTNTKEHA